MAISKVIFNGVTQMDDTANTITSNKVLEGYIGKDAAGETVTGNIGTGSATPASSISATGASVSTGTNTLTLSKSSVSNTPQVTAGYISSGTAGNSSVSLTASVTTKAAATITPTTTNQTIASGTYLTGTQTIAGDVNLVAGNIKKDVTIFNTTGSYEGSGGTITLKRGVVRPDAELVQTWSGDYLAHTDKSITIPSYSTTATTLYTGTASSTKPTLSNANYRYYVLERFLTIPQYSVTTKAAGRQEYTAMSICYEIVQFPGSTFKALVDGTAYTSRNTAAIAAGNAFVRCLYWSSGSALAVYTANTYGCAQTMTAPSVSSATSASPTLTITEPSLTIRGSGTYLSSTYYNAITDIRAQYVIELYRVPLDTDSTYGISGWGHYTQMLNNINCAQSSTHKLT